MNTLVAWVASESEAKGMKCGQERTVAACRWTPWTLVQQVWCVHKPTRWRTRIPSELTVSTLSLFISKHLNPYFLQSFVLYDHEFYSSYFILSPGGSLGKLETQCWVPLVAKQFPAKSPFANQSSTASLRVPPELHHTTPQRSKSIRKGNREVKFETAQQK